MKKFLQWIGGILLFAVLAVAALGLHSYYFRPLFPSWFYNRVLLVGLLDDPEIMTSLGILPTWLGSYNSRLSDASPEHEAKMAKWADDALQTLRTYDRAAMDQEGKISYDSMEIFLSDQVEAYRFRDDYPVNQMFGLQAGMPNFMTNQVPITNRREAADYVARLKLFGWKFDGVLAGLKERADRGVVPPHFTIVEVIDQMKGFTGKPATENPLYTVFASKLGKLPVSELSTEAKNALLADAETAISEIVYPAYGRMIAFFTELEPAHTADNGVWSLPDGDAYYAWCIRSQTTTKMTPDEIHALGLAEVARIKDDMDAALKKLGKSEGSVGQRMKALGADPALYYANDDQGRAEILKDYTAILAEADKATEKTFDIRPTKGITVESVPEFAQATAPSAYYEAGDMSGKRGGVFFFNQRDLKETPKWSMRTLAYHEGIPGHHFQISIAQEQKGLPMFRQMIGSFLFTSYTEGWALYAEHLAGEMGLEDNPLDALGRYNDEMLRAVRLVVDSGIHAKHWTREQAIDYLEGNTGMGHGQVVAEIERYFVAPGQATAYKVGELKILALRAKAQAELGDKFDIRAFHDQVLTHGGLAMTSLESVIDDWIARVKSGA